MELNQFVKKNKSKKKSHLAIGSPVLGYCRDMLIKPQNPKSYHFCVLNPVKIPQKLLKWSKFFTSFIFCFAVKYASNLFLPTADQLT